MRIVHFSDTHLGYSDYGKFDSETGVNQRELDTYTVFEGIVDYIISTKPDLAIHAGDLFDSIRPSNKSISVAMEQFSRLSEHNIPTVIIAGNHSTPRQSSTDSIFKTLRYFPNINPVFEGRYRKLKIGDCAIHAIPHMYSDQDLQESIQQLEPDKNMTYNIIIAHAAIRGAELASWGEFNELTIPTSALSADFNYIALGHYHRFLKIKENAYYCGSPERFSFNEIEDSKGFLDVELDDFKIKRVMTKARDMIICGPIDCTNLSAIEVMDKFEESVYGRTKGKIIKVVFDNIERHIYSSLDLKKIKNLVIDALHYEPAYNWKKFTPYGDHKTSNIGSLDEEFENFIRLRNMGVKEKTEMSKLGAKYLELITKLDSE